MAGTGAPLGNRRAAKGKDWFDALRKECVQRGSLAKIAAKVVDAAEAGEQWAIAEIGNRFDGKPAQSLDIDANVQAEVNWPLPKPPLEG
jgi:hypothetical protein